MPNGTLKGTKKTKNTAVFSKNMLKSTFFTQNRLSLLENVVILHSQIAGWSSGSSLGS